MFLITIAFTLFITTHSAWCMDVGVCYLELSKDTEIKIPGEEFSYSCTKIDKPNTLVKSDSTIARILGGQYGYLQRLQFNNNANAGSRVLQSTFKEVTKDDEIDWIVFLSEDKIVGVISKMYRDMCFQSLRFTNFHSSFNVFPQTIDDFINLDALIKQNPTIGLEVYQSIQMSLQNFKLKFKQERIAQGERKGASLGDALREDQCNKLIKQEVEEITDILAQHLPLIVKQEMLQPQTNDSKIDNPAINRSQHVRTIFGCLLVLVMCSIPLYHFLFSQ